MIVWMRHINSKAHAFLYVPNEIRDVTALCGVGRMFRKWGDTVSMDRCRRCVRADEALRRKSEASK